MFSIAFSSLFSQDAVNRRPASAESSRNRVCRLTARLHPLRQSGFLSIKRLGPTDLLAPCPTCLACRCTSFPTEFKLKLGEAGEYSGDHTTGRVHERSIHA